MSKQSFIDQLAEQHKKVKPTETTIQRFIRWFIICLLCIIIGMASLGLRKDWNQLFLNPLLLLQNAFIFFMTMMSGFLSIRLSVPGSLSTQKALKAKKYPFIFWLLCLILIATFNGFSLEEFKKVSFLGCTKDIIVIGLVPCLILFTLILQGTVLKRTIAGYLAMIASFGLGAWVVQFTCHNDDPIHVFLWHFLPVLALGYLGIQLAKRFFPKI